MLSCLSTLLVKNAWFVDCLDFLFVIIYAVSSIVSFFSSAQHVISIFCPLFTHTAAGHYSHCHTPIGELIDISQSHAYNDRKFPEPIVSVGRFSKT